MSFAPRAGQYRHVDCTLGPRPDRHRGPHGRPRSARRRHRAQRDPRRPARLPRALDWTVNAYSLTFAVLLITGAALGDRYGRRRLFVTGIGLFSAASASCALAPNTAT